MNKSSLLDFESDENQIFVDTLMIMTRIVNCAGEGWAYRKHWSDEFRCQELNDIFENNYKKDEEFWKQVFDLPVEQKMLLGFRYFDKNDTKMLIPIWIWNLLPPDMYIEDGGKTVKELDNDTRGGVVFWKA